MRYFYEMEDELFEVFDSWHSSADEPIAWFEHREDAEAFITMKEQADEAASHWRSVLR